MIGSTGTNNHHALYGVQKKFNIFCSAHRKLTILIMHPVQTADAGGVEGNGTSAEAYHRLESMGKHLRADYLETVLERLALFSFFFLRPAFQLSFDRFFHKTEFSGYALYAVFVRKPGYPMPSIRKMLVFKIDLKIAFLHPHCNAAYSEVFIRLVACPGAVDGNISDQRAPVDHSHGKVASVMPIAMTVEDALGCVPLCSGDNSLVVARLVILVLLASVFLRFMIVEVGGPGLARQYVAAVAFVAHHIGNR